MVEVELEEQPRLNSGGITLDEDERRRTRSGMAVTLDAAALHSSAECI